MIHSLAGGSFKEKQLFDFAKVEIMEGVSTGVILWYLLPDGDFKVGDNVIVPLGLNNVRTKGKILRIDRDRIEGSTPIPIKNSKKIIDKI